MLGLQLEGLTVGALIYGRRCFVSSNLDLVQRAVVLLAGVIRTLLDGTFDTFIDLAHKKILHKF